MVVEISKTFTKKVYFIWILSNVDESIINFKFKKGLQVHFRFRFEEFLSEMLNVPAKEIKNSLREKGFRTFYLISSFEINLKSTYERYELHEATINYINDILDYLDPLLRKMRLYKRGNIGIPEYYAYSMEDSKPTFIYGLKDERFVFKDIYHLETNEIDDLTHFLDIFDLPFKHKFLKLACENFEVSYTVPDLYLQFLSLMNALEVLLKSSKTELRYRLSRNGAVLLGKDRQDSNKIYNELKCLYDIRSSIVHSGEAKDCKKKGKSLSNEQMLKNTAILREYVRDSIKEMNYIIKKENKNKDEILKMLNESGFGERSWYDE